MQVLEDTLARLEGMPPEEGIKVLQQLFNPMRGRYVGYIRKPDRSTFERMVEEEQDKEENKSSRRVVGYLVTARGRKTIYRRTKEARCEGFAKDWPKTTKGDKRFKEDRI